MGSATIVCALRVLTSTHKPTVIFIYELKTNSFQKSKRFLSSLGFPNLKFISVPGSTGGMVLGWKSIVNNSICYIKCIVDKYTSAIITTTHFMAIDNNI